jgi:hypothetical protein
MYALAARRAIEARYVVDLSTLTEAETFVASPATWADSIYTYDLSMPTAVGLDTSAGSSSSSGAVYANQLQDYVGNLQAFVAGYAVSRPAAVDNAELDIVTLTGLQAGTNSDGTPDTSTIGNWSYHCPGTGAWISLPAGLLPDTACTDANGDPPKPDTIRFSFNLDPWARLDGDLVNPPDSYRFNGRWTQMAVNFVGTGVKDCTQAADPQGCYSEEWIPYNLTHVGPAWVTDYNEIWHELDVPTGIIEGAKGLAAELWLDPLQDGWSTPYISAVARSELSLRPLGGAYLLEVPVAPEVVLGNIQRVQILVGSTYWVKQQ